jgi:muramoyltetrapeptide carboxypeptidase
MIVPKALYSGDKIRIISPAGKVDEKYVLPAAEWLREQGYEVELGKHVFARHYQFAGTDKQRLEDLQDAINDTESKAILCSRGGYGTVRIIDEIDFSRFLEKPKWLIGFSDITILHTCLNNMNVATIHGVMPRYFFNDKEEPTENLKSLMKLLTGQRVSYNLSAQKDNREGKVTGKITGGNLSIISSLQGTKYEIDTEGKILFLEDIDEFLYHTDRMMHQLKLSGKLTGLAGLILGDFTDMKDNESPFGKTIREIITEAVSDYNYPVCFEFPAGHNSKNVALSFGQNWELNVSENQSELKLL